MFGVAKKETGDGLEACKGCKLLSTKPGNFEKSADDDVEDLVLEIADIVSWEDAGSATDWTLYPFEMRMLHRIWRDAEKRVLQVQAVRMQMFIKSFGSAS